LSAFGIVGYAWRIEPIWPEWVRRSMPIPNLPADFEGMRLVQISDLHVGAGVPMVYLDKWIDAINDRGADLIVVTGDLVHHPQPERARAAARLLGRLRATHGVLAVLGNHDWGTTREGGGIRRLADRVRAALSAEGIRVLTNESVVIRRGTSRLWVVGVDDYWGDRHDPAGATADVPASGPYIALVHNPDSAWELLDKPPAWVLAGHTHGGQVSIPLVGPPVVPTRHKQLVAGHYRLGTTSVYVNRGLGWVKRLRFNARPEITEFTLARA